MFVIRMCVFGWHRKETHLREKICQIYWQFRGKTEETQIGLEEREREAGWKEGGDDNDDDDDEEVFSASLCCLPDIQTNKQRGNRAVTLGCTHRCVSVCWCSLWIWWSGGLSTCRFKSQTSQGECVSVDTVATVGADNRLLVRRDGSKHRC